MKKVNIKELFISIIVVLTAISFVTLCLSAILIFVNPIFWGFTAAISFLVTNIMLFIIKSNPSKEALEIKIEQNADEIVAIKYNDVVYNVNKIDIENKIVNCYLDGEVIEHGFSFDQLFEDKKLKFYKPAEF